MSIAETIWSALVHAGFVTMLMVVLVFFLKDTLREWVFTRIRAGIQHDFDTELETHKAKLALQTEERMLRLTNDLKAHRAFLDTVRSSFFEGQRSTMERKLIAVDKVWDEVLKMRRLTLPTMTYVDVFRESETDDFKELRKSDLGSIVLQGSSTEEIKERIQTISSDLERVRPFASEHFWSLLECYRAIHLRVFVVIGMFADDASKVLRWFADERTYGIVAAVLDGSEQEYFNNMQFGKFTWLNRKLEAKMLAELRHIVSGQQLAQDALGKIGDAEIERMRRAAASAQDDAC